MQPEPTAQPTTVSQQAQIDARLHALHPTLTRATLHEAIQYGFEHAGDCTGNDVGMMEGILAWGKPMRRLREKLLPQGWTRSKGHFETVISPDRTFQIASSVGNWATGLEHYMPQTGNEKGPLTAEAVIRNQPPPAMLFDSESEDHIQTWVLLSFVDSGAHEIRIELSLPTHASGKQRRFVVDQFEPRIKLDPVSFGDQVDIEDEDEEDIDIDLPRRQQG